MTIQISRLKYFRLMTGREPTPLETLQNAGKIEIDEEELERLQQHNREQK